MALASLIETWSSLYSNSAPLRTAVSFAHVGGLLTGGGCAIAADRAVLRAARTGGEHYRFAVESLHTTHRTVIAGLIFVVISGLLLLAADVDSYLHSYAFWIKMALFAALLANGLLLTRAGRQTERGDDAWHALRMSSIASLILWLVTTLAGAALPNAL